MEYQTFTAKEPFGKTSEQIQLVNDDGSILVFPNDINNINYGAYLDWVNAGNTPKDVTP